MKGFRPGKEPKQLKKRAAKAQLGTNASWAQKATVDAIAGRSPQEVRAMIQRWSLGLMVGGVALLVGGFFLYGVSVPGGIAVHVLAAAAFFLTYRVRKSARGLEEMAGTLLLVLALTVPAEAQDRFGAAVALPSPRRSGRPQARCGDRPGRGRRLPAG